MPWKFSTGFCKNLMTDKGFIELMNYGQIRIFSGPQPASADDAETGTLLCIITNAAKAMSSGIQENGLELILQSNKIITKKTGDIWTGINAATGTAGWFRWYPNDFIENIGAASDTQLKTRIDGSCGTINAQINFLSTNFKAGNTTTIDNITITF